MQTIHNSACLELPPVKSGQYCGLTGAVSTSYKDAGLPLNLRLDHKDRAFTFPLRLEVSDRTFESQNPIRGLEAAQPLCHLLASIVHTESFLHLLEDCIIKKDVAIGRGLHTFIAENGLELDSFFCSHLVRMFSSLDLLVDADRVFLKLSKPNIFVWSAIISAYTKSGENYQVIRLYHEMQNARIEPDSYVSVTVLKACAMSATLAEGEQTHAHVLEHGLESDAFVNSALINMYSYVHHGHGKEALWLFYKMRDGGFVPDRITFLSAVKACSRISVLEIGYAQHGFGHEALQIFQEMLQKDITPNPVTFVCVVNACARIAALEQGKKVQCSTHLSCNGVLPDQP
ncbi:hypothetical protein GOP47_0013614 [Adiantum capillus-veneris]|uniref:Pentatricopeptide repeat-containing protein n=1 Tax=Adiantum capillus-veneris TaxID=13818 RepID=A0A9D4ZDD9_ADICA|nr:hypothetical protein GOP47_0013614 [Adiantum capillus-veneris]